MDKLALKFEEELRDKMYIAKKECKYNATYFIQMMNENGGVNTAKTLIAKAIQTGQLSDGFTRLFMEGRLDLSMEDSVCKDEYEPLFSDVEIAYCRKVMGKSSK